ncbi:MAG: lipid-A-disaccharide synthase [Moritella sp.]|uniref:lipid-A-disaccharide synthase n=1 Tax=Moritella sp. TaxID=78556 RepID=UPI0029A05EE5|nr:lipid-A-disaccharide synthase [Moritella sp.]MDX2322547.1 lipid-A-disaccharide synthase [Moritella sp.]
MTTKPLRIGIIAGEVSGDILAAALIKEIKSRHPDAIFEGIAGPRMQALGFNTLFEMEELSVFGLVEVLGRLPRLFKVKREVLAHFKQNPPDIFIGVDAPDFNIPIELKLKSDGIKTVHYVSPSVWAWRQKRVFKIKKAVDMVLAFLPFEKAFYDEYDVPCRFIGHTMADSIPLAGADKQAAIAQLKLDPKQRYVAILPGSRAGEVGLLSASFLETALLLKQRFSDLQFVVPMVNEERKAQFLAIKQEVAPELDVIILDGHAREAMAVADAVLLASGTAALETMLMKRAMVVGYRVKPLTYKIMLRLMKAPFVSLPNLLAKKEIVAERLQDDCQPEILADEMAKLLETDNAELMALFTELHQQIRCNADKKAADAVLELINEDNIPAIEQVTKNV